MTAPSLTMYHNVKKHDISVHLKTAKLMITVLLYAHQHESIPRIIGRDMKPVS